MTMTSGAQELEAASLRRTHRPETLGFGSTAEVQPLEGPVGQDRAAEAIAFGLETRMAGYNIPVTGPVGVGKRSALEAQLHEQARERPSPGDRVYLHNFHDPRQPIAVALGSGQGEQLVGDMRRFLEDERRELAAAFESDTYSRRQRELTEPIEREQEAALTELREQAQAGGIALELTPTGVMTVPLRGGQPMTPVEFAGLPESVRNRYQTAIEDLGPPIQAFLAGMRARQREARSRLRALEHEVPLFAGQWLASAASTAISTNWVESQSRLSARRRSTNCSSRSSTPAPSRGGSAWSRSKPRTSICPTR